MATEFAIVPRGRKYWIEAIGRDGTRRAIERYDTEDKAVERLHMLQHRAETAAREALEAVQHRPVMPSWLRY